MKTILIQTGAIAAFGLLFGSSASAGSFTITGASTSPQTLGPGAGQTGAITSSGTLSVGGSSVAVTISGDDATLTNLGALEQTGTGRAIRDNTGVSNLVVTNGSSTNSTAVMQTSDADVIQMNKSPASVTLNNYGQMISENVSGGGAQVVDFNAIQSGKNVVNNYATGVMLSTNADVVRPGVDGVVYNAGKMIATNPAGGGGDGVDAQTNSGVQITNDTGGLIEGRHGITGGDPARAPGIYTMSIVNNAGATIQGDDGSGVNIDGVNGNDHVTIVNHDLITGYGVTGDGDGVDVDGVMNLTNTGTIHSLNAVGSASEGISVGGGKIVNSGTIEGSVAAGNTSDIARGITLTGNKIAGSPGEREPIYTDEVVTNEAGGLIEGDNDSGIAVVGSYASGHTVTIDNEAGATIKGGGATAAALDASSSFDNDIITDAGTIDSSSSGKAISLGAGNNTLTIKGGAASIKGDVSGGVGGKNTLNFDIGKGDSFSYGDVLSNFADVEVNSGRTTLSGANTYSGKTTVNGGALLVDNTTGSGTGTGAVEVKAGTLGGTGAISGPVAVDAGGKLSPGDGGVGAPTVGGATLSAGSRLFIDLDPTDSLGQGLNDVLNVNGAVALNGADLVLDLLSAPTIGESFDIVTTTAGVSGLFSEGYELVSSFDGQAYGFRIDYAYVPGGGMSGEDIRLTSTAVPEPTTFVLMALGGAAAGWRRLRKAA